MARKRRSYTDEFKREAVRLVREQGLTAAQVGRDLGVDRSVIGAWVHKADEGEMPSSANAADRDELHAEIRRLRKELAKVTEERAVSYTHLTLPTNREV